MVCDHGASGPRVTASPYRADHITPFSLQRLVPMPVRTKKTVAKTAPRRAAKSEKRPEGGLGKLPEWNLTDLYAGIDDPKVKRDLDRADEYSKGFEDDFKGKLAAIADSPGGGAKLAQAVIRYEQLDDLLGRLISIAGLLH